MTMKRVLLAMAMVAGVSTVAAPSASAMVDAPPAQCGNHSKVFFSYWYSYWGNCTGRPALIDVYQKLGSQPSKLVRQECVAVDEDKHLGSVPMWLPPAYTGEDTGQSC